MNTTNLLHKLSYILCFILFSCSQRQNQNQFEISLNDNWRVYPSEKLSIDGSKISVATFNDSNWYRVNIPSTVLNTLVKNGVYTDLMTGKNYDSVSTKPFLKSWWYRKTFDLHEKPENLKLILNGINYKANIWINGTMIADTNTIEGAYKISELEITRNVQSKNNVLAIEVIPPRKGDLTIGFVDWNPKPKDGCIGLWRGVSLHKSGKVALSDVYVKTDVNTQTLSEASIAISAELKNNTEKDVDADVECHIGDITVSQKVSLLPNEQRTVSFTPNAFKNLMVKQPKLWWPNNMGAQNLHNLSIDVKTGNRLSDHQKVRFGIRKIEQYWTEKGHKGWMVNGKKVLIRGGGWVDDIMLADSDEKVRAQVKYAKIMNLNALRLEGFWGNNSALYDAADENGILIMTGWSCQWEWQEHCGREATDGKYMMIREKREKQMQSEAYFDQVRWLRNHPSIFLWVLGSDLLPEPDLERTLIDKLSIIDPSRPVLSSCRDIGLDLPMQVSSVTGPTGSKMRGPYGYVTPNYWYIDSTNGGAFGFNSETGPGEVIPPIESMKKMIPKKYLWPINDVWNYHASLYAFSGHKNIFNAINGRYGKVDNADDFIYLAQVSNYEALRGMYEAFITNKFEATGVIQWMFNSAWPSTYWQLFDWYLMPTGAFYGTQNACEPLHLSYNYKDKDIYILNETLNEFKGLKGSIKVLNQDSKVVFDKNFVTDVAENSSKKAFKMPSNLKLSQTYFIELSLSKSDGSFVDDNFYWLSTTNDELEYAKSDGFFTPIKKYANLKGIRQLPETNISVKHTFSKSADMLVCNVELENTSNTLAFFIEFAIKGQKSGETFLPVYWSDNYVSLLPGQKKKISAQLDEKLIKTDKPVLHFRGVNVKETISVN